MDYRAYLPAILKSRPTWQLAAGAGAIVIVAAIGLHAALRHAPAEAAGSTAPHVMVASVGDLTANAGPLEVVGQVKSKAQATILAQTAGELVSLSRSIGDYVAAGAVIGQFENSSQRAAVTQAQGAYDAAQASLSRVTGVSATNSSVSSASAATAAANAGDALSAAMRSAYVTLDDAVHTKADALFVDSRSNVPRLQSFTVTDSQLVVSVGNERLSVGASLSDAQTASNATVDLSTNAAHLVADARTIGAFLDDLVQVLNHTLPDQQFSAATIAADQASIAAARSAVAGVVSSVTAAKSAYETAQAGAQTAATSADAGTQSDIASAKAAVKSAQGTLDAARAALEKTIVRSPVSGTIVSLPVSQGDYVANFAPIATVSNPGTLYIEAQVTPDDARALAAGNPVVIERRLSGNITFVAPAIDPTTGKITVKTSVADASALTDGETVSLALGRTPTTHARTTSTTIPIAAVKMLPQGAVVFTVSASSTLAAMPVTLGDILGDRVTVSGITPETEILTDARGRAEGEMVIVATTTSSVSR